MLRDIALWQRTLEAVPNDIHSSARERLRVNYESCRERASLVAAEIRRDQPDYTVHDITHMDALWEQADTIAGPAYPITPLEGFIFGCAALVHDLAMGLAAFPRDTFKVIGDARWKDALYIHLQDKLGRSPTPAELADPPSHIAQMATREILRELHAEQAARLPHEPFQDRVSDASYFLIQDVDLRNMYGDVIGRIAASHWWDLGKLADEFDSRLGAPAYLPRDWSIDQLKLACLLRVADASHLDTRRAPGFLRAISHVGDQSRIYWIFQERLNRPWVDGDRLTYTAPQPFPPEDSQSWWLCVDTLRMVDRELRGVDALLADTTRSRFAARSVAYVDDLERLSRSIPVRGWYPIDARIKIGDVIDLVRKLGGQQLYGDNPRAAMREIISNAADAVRARRALEGPQASSELRLRIQVEIRNENDDTWLLIRDNGLGMSREVMSGPLLDFGKSYWNSASSRQDFPGLISSGFSPTGRFGIGFFSVFMLGDYVRVTSRRFDLGAPETYVLVFDKGLNSRPLLREGHTDEALPYGGTEVAVKLHPSIADELLIPPYQTRKQWTLATLCAWLCPTSDIDIDIASGRGSFNHVIRAGDWTSCPGQVFIRRVSGGYRQWDKSLPRRIRPILSKDGRILGRAAIILTDPKGIRHFTSTEEGVITVGGVRSEEDLNNVAGALLGETTRAARDSAVAIANYEEIAAWGTEQARLISAANTTVEQQLEAASMVCAVGGDTGDLPIAQCKYGPVTSSQVSSLAADNEVIYLWQDDAFYLSRMDLSGLLDNVLLVEVGYLPLYSEYHVSLQSPDDTPRDLCAKLVFRAWGLSDEDCEIQLSEQRSVIDEYYERHGPIEDDPNYPFQVEVGRDAQGNSVTGHVTILRRTTEDI